MFGGSEVCHDSSTEFADRLSSHQIDKRYWNICESSLFRCDHFTRQISSPHSPQKKLWGDHQPHPTPTKDFHSQGGSFRGGAQTMRNKPAATTPKHAPTLHHDFSGGGADSMAPTDPSCNPDAKACMLKMGWAGRELVTATL